MIVNSEKKKKIKLQYLTPDYGRICIYVAIAIINIVVFSGVMDIVNLLDSDADFERRKPTPHINLVYSYVTRYYSGAKPVPFIIDLNDPTGLRMKTLFDSRRKLKEIGGVWGFPCKNTTVDNIGVLRANAEPFPLDALEGANKGVLSKGMPIQRVPGTFQYICQILVLKSRLSKGY